MLQMMRRLAGVFIVGGALIGTGIAAQEATPESTVAVQESGTFTAGDCPEGTLEGAECGFVTVPARHDQPDGATLQIAVARVVSQDPNRIAEPIFFLSGGPGETALPTFVELASVYTFADLVVFDQRGTGASEPVLTCDAYAEALVSEVTATGDDVAAPLYDALEGCGADFVAQGVDLGALTTTQTANDVNTIRAALGYERINLYGISYGTRLAQRIVQVHPDMVNAVVLDSVIPPQIDRPADTPRSAAESLQRVFDACAADPTCSANYPDLQAVYEQLYTDLNAAPPNVTLTIQEEPLEFPLTGDVLQGLVFGSLYNPQAIAELPALIFFVRDGAYERINESTAWQISQIVSEAINLPIFFTVECQGEVAFSDPTALEQTYAELPQWQPTLGVVPGISSTGVYELCANLGLGASEGENDPVQSDVPTLLLAGQFDPVTPPRYLETVSEGLTNATAVELPGQAHAVSLSSECGAQIVGRFLLNPTTDVDTSCTAELAPVFITPDQIGAS